MYNSDFDHQSSHKLRRILALAGIGASLVMILGVVVFSVRASIVPGINQHSPVQTSPGTSFRQVHNSCHTPPHRAGNSTLSIHLAVAWHIASPALSAIKLLPLRRLRALSTVSPAAAIRHGLFRCWKFTGKLMASHLTMATLLWAWQQYRHI